MERRKLPYLLGLLMTGASLGTACLPETSAVEAKLTPPLSPGLLPTPTPSSIPQFEFPRFIRGEFNTGLGKLYWSNTTRAEFDPKAAAAIYQIYEIFSQRKLRLTTQMFSLGRPQDNEVINILLGPKTPQDRFLTMIPFGAPVPDWIKPEDFYGIKGDSKDSLLRIFTVKKELPPNLAAKGPEWINNENFHNLVCLATSEILASRPVSLLASENQVEKTAKLSVCNSFGLAIDVKTQQLPYKGYLNLIRQTRLIWGPYSLAYSLLVLPKEEYDELPQIKAIRLSPTPWGKFS